jgi:hypothetical protein
MAEKELTERAIEDPAREFTTPEAVVTHPALPKEGKLSILQRWQQLVATDAKKAAPAGSAPDLPTRIGRALAMLDTETGKHEVSHDQGFYTSIGDIGKH